MENLTPETRLEYYLDKITAGGGSSGGGGILKVMITETEDSQGHSIYVLDKNYTEITTALNNGMLPIFIGTFGEGDTYGYVIYYLYQYGFSSSLEQYTVIIQTFNFDASTLEFFASGPTDVLHTRLDK